MRLLNELFTTITRRDPGYVADPMEQLHGHSAQIAEACRQLLASDGEASSVSLARRTLDMYARLSHSGRLEFFQHLARAYEPDPEVVHAAYNAFCACLDADKAQALFRSCEPPRQELFRRLNLAPGGTYSLVRMRAALLENLREHPKLGAVDADFVHLFGSWFNRGFLVLRRIDWNTPAAILEKIIKYEAVHEIRDWADLRRRLAPTDRRCFAFFHPATGNEPLIFVEVALSQGLPDRIQPILGSAEPFAGSPEEADTAAFFGISNCQTGLRKISFGNFLIKQVVEELKRELPNLKYFVTLSPIPGFTHWLAAERDSPESPLDEGTRNALAALDMTDWHCSDTAKILRDAVLPQAARYLTEARNSCGELLNPVARFHLGNGARLHRLNWLGDVSPKGLKDGAGVMVNYLYVLDEIESNHERYAVDGTVIASNGIRKLGRQARKQMKRGESHE